MLARRGRATVDANVIRHARWFAYTNVARLVIAAVPTLKIGVTGYCARAQAITRIRMKIEVQARMVAITIRGSIEHANTNLTYDKQGITSVHALPAQTIRNANGRYLGGKARIAIHFTSIQARIGGFIVVYYTERRRRSGARVIRTSQQYAGTARARGTGAAGAGRA